VHRSGNLFVTQVYFRLYFVIRSGYK